MRILLVEDELQLANAFSVGSVLSLTPGLKQPWATISKRLRRWVGLNVEGVAWDRQKRRLLLGLRSPVVNGHALVVPLKLRDQTPR
jgi:hypothetical protein